MCGIYFALHATKSILPDDHLQNLLRARGPDVQSILQLTCRQDQHDGAPLRLTFCSSVLSLRGEEPIPQPLRDEAAGLVLCWNGEAWKISDLPVSGNDTQVVFQKLTQALASLRAGSQTSRREAIARQLSEITGPFAFVLYDSHGRQVIFGRDRLGRRSLLKSTESNGFSICSVPTSDSRTWSEIETNGLYYLDLQRANLDGSHVYEAKEITQSLIEAAKSTPSLQGCSSALTESRGTVGLNRRSPGINPPALELYSNSVTALKANLQQALKLRILAIPHYNHAKDASVNFLPRKEKISTESPIPGSEGDRSSNYPSKLAVLFSGGVDCTVLARMSHNLLPPEDVIDLLNVSFENPRVHAQVASPYEACPDRITARKALVELKSTCQNRRWRLVEINVPYSEAKEHRSTVVQLIKPHSTEMDLSIALALYFAARGVGVTEASVTGKLEPYRTPARVLLSGLGADELFGGYQRYATAFAHSGFEGLLDELELDISRIGRRNLGRDDRVISHWGREVRYPYLDEDLFSWANTLPVWEKCGFRTQSSPDQPEKEAGEDLEPGKKILRLLAQRLDLYQVAREKKRAIQFGARTAKMDAKKTKGTDLLSP
ncbi:MAG: hypothetical protein M1820_000556 [Bogoriella megaspora]|nr:MAG: hypothetical protein M1820_000556 [Bogoriella megaspora]